jgi:hypothetical protein
MNDESAGTIHPFSLVSIEIVAPFWEQRTKTFIPALLS